MNEILQRMIDTGQTRFYHTLTYEEEDTFQKYKYEEERYFDFRIVEAFGVNFIPKYHNGNRKWAKNGEDCC